MADQAETATIGRRKEALADPKKRVEYWLAQLRAAEKQEKDWRTDADEAVDRFNGKKGKNAAFNILHSNVATIAPAVYNSTPTPDIRPRHQPPPQQLVQAQPQIYQMRAEAYEVARRGAQVQEAALAYCLDEYDFDAVIKRAVQDNNVVGRGVTRLRYKTHERMDKDAGAQLTWEEVYAEHVPWRQFRRGPGATWDQIGWIALRYYYDLDALDEITGDPAISDKIPRDVTDEWDQDKDDKKGQELTAFKKAAVWQIWDKESRQVIFICEGYPDAPLREMDDPLGLTDFFPIVRPLQAIADPDNMTPTVPFELYKQPATELEEISQRILANVKMLKVRGLRASELKELEEIFKLDDGEFLASEGALTLLSGGMVNALDATLWMVPIDKIIVVVRELVLQRAEIKQQIFEITGIADIMRGQTKASETLGAQQIKANWGSLRIQDQQKEVQRYCRDILRLKCEIIGNKFSKETLSIMVGDIVPDEVMALLRNDVRRSYLIDVETDSTIRADLTRNQEQMANFMTGTAQFFVPLLQAMSAGQIPPPVASTAIVVYSAFARQFRLGKQVEDSLAALEGAAQQMVQQPQQAEQPPAGQVTQEQVDAEGKQKLAVGQEQIKQAQAKTAAAAAGAQTAQAKLTGQRIANMQRLKNPPGSGNGSAVR